jgi:uncharacterized protein (TIGR02145 family)
MDESGTLTLNAGAGATVSATPDKAFYNAGEQVRITATPDSGYMFVEWTGKQITCDTSAAITITVVSDMVIDATFRVMPRAVVHGLFYDARNGKTYRTVKIAGKTWMAEDINYKSATGNSLYLYNNDDPDSCNKYGMLYDWNAATEACPAGWHLSSHAEWKSLWRAAGGKRHDNWNGAAGKRLKAKCGWSWDYHENESGNGTDDYGFSALPCGIRDDRTGDFYAGSHYGIWWTATKSDAASAYSWDMYYNHGDLYKGVAGKSDMFSVRCVKDGP